MMSDSQLFKDPGGMSRLERLPLQDGSVRSQADPGVTWTERSADGASLMCFYHRQLREVAEELGIEIDPRELFPLGESVYANKKKRVQCFSWKAKGALELRLDNREISDAKLLTLDEAREILHEAQRVFVDRLADEFGR